MVHVGRKGWYDAQSTTIVTFEDQFILQVLTGTDRFRLTSQSPM